MSDQNALSAVLAKHRQQDSAFQERLNSINHTRAQITDQLQLLQHGYDKKIKQLEQRLDQLKTQNDSLHKQNIIYKADIDNYQARLVEKERIIAMLLSQKKEFHGAGGGSSDPSKSDNTDSVQNQEDQEYGKLFKKQHHYHPHDKEHSENGAQPPKKEVVAAPVVAEQTKSREKASPKVHQVIEEEVPLAVFNPVPPQTSPPKTVETLHPAQGEFDNHESQEIAPPVALTARPTPPPPRPNKKMPPHKKKREAPKRLYADNSVEEAEQSEAIVNGSEQPETDDPVTEVKPEESHGVSQSNEETGQSNRQEYAFWESTGTELREEATEEPYVPNNYVEEPTEEEEFNSNFLSHFNKQDEGPAEEEVVNRSAPVPPPPRPKPKVKAARTESMEQEESSSADFFSQLARGEPEGHHELDIEESSIDHVDRDSSVISNEQQYFADVPSSKPEKGVRMPKKRGKRDKIKVIDPTMF